MEYNVEISTDDNEYTFTPSMIGIYQLQIAIKYLNNIDNINLGIPVFNTPIKLIRLQNRPTSVAVTANEQVIVCESNGHCITIVDFGGSQSFGSHGNQKSELVSPHDVVITSKGTLLVADSGNHRLQEFTMDGECVSCVGSKGDDGPLQFNWPNSIAINKITDKDKSTDKDKVYVVECDNH